MLKSKKFLGLYVEKYIKDKLISIAKKNKRSVSAEVVLRIEESIKEDLNDNENKTKN